MRRLSSLCRSGRTSKDDGGGMEGGAGGASTAGVAAPVGGCDARAAWGVGAADIVQKKGEGCDLWRAGLVLRMRCDARDDAPRTGIAIGLCNVGSQ